jgi:poly-gamma-glutamate synthesis protein (capsule biosynthesis protein)
MRGSPGFAPVLRQLGFNVLNVANNHAMQHGTAAFQESVDTLRKAGIQPCGIRGSDGWASEPVRIRCSDDSSAGVLAYCLRPRQYGDTEPLYAEGDAASICADVARLSREVDTVIVSLHWGEEFVPAPSRSEVALGDAILNAGAAVILGHHPHVARPVTATDSRVIAFSLGNFAADMIWQEPLRHGLLLECTLQSGAVTGTRVLRTHIEDSLATRITTVELPLTPYGEVHALPEPAYADEIARTIGSQRLAAYRFALGNVHRYGRGMFRQMIGTTLLNKFRRSSP